MSGDPPMKALRLEMVVDGHTPEDLARQFAAAALRVEEYASIDAGWFYISGGGWHASALRRSDLTAEEYDRALIEWHQNTRRVREDAQ